MDENSRTILSYLENNNIVAVGREEEVVKRFMDKLEDHDLWADDDNIQQMVDEYGDEILNPIKAVFSVNPDEW